MKNFKNQKKFIAYKFERKKFELKKFYLVNFVLNVYMQFFLLYKNIGVI